MTRLRMLVCWLFGHTGVHETWRAAPGSGVMGFCPRCKRLVLLPSPNDPSRMDRAVWWILAAGAIVSGAFLYYGR